MTKKKQLKQVSAADLAKVAGGLAVASEMEEGPIEVNKGKSAGGPKSRGVSMQ